MASKMQSPYSRREVVDAGATMAAASMTSASPATGQIYGSAGGTGQL